MVKKVTVIGTLSGYWEQGMEGRIVYAFIPKDPTVQDEGEQNKPIFIQNGHYLKIYKPDRNVLWEGEIKLVSRKHWLFFREKHTLPNEIWNDYKQEGVPYEKWIAWFWQEPPLLAELTLVNPE